MHGPFSRGLTAYVGKMVSIHAHSPLQNCLPWPERGYGRSASILFDGGFAEDSEGRFYPGGGLKPARIDRISQAFYNARFPLATPQQDALEKNAILSEMRVAQSIRSLHASL